MAGVLSILQFNRIEIQKWLHRSSNSFDNLGRQLRDHSMRGRLTMSTIRDVEAGDSKSSDPFLFIDGPPHPVSCTMHNKRE